MNSTWEKQREQIVLVTGANGFVGKLLVQKLIEKGYHIRALVRNISVKLNLNDRVEYFECNLPNHIDERAFHCRSDQKIVSLVHCAYLLNSTNYELANKTNIEGTKNIVALCRKNKISHLVFLSSFAAHAEAESFYGRTKFQLESLFDQPTDCIIRPSLIVGNGSAFSRTLQMIKKLPVIPLFYADKKIQVVSNDSLCTAILNAIELKKTGLYHVSAPASYRLQDFYSILAKHLNKKAVFIPFSGGLTLIFCKVFERFKVPLPITSENLLGMRKMKEVDVKKDLLDLHIKPESLEACLKKI